MIEPKLQQIMLLAQVKSMIIELNERLGDANPYADLSVDTYGLDELIVLKRNLHELLYAPPPRGR